MVQLTGAGEAGEYSPAVLKPGPLPDYLDKPAWLQVGDIIGDIVFPSGEATKFGVDFIMSSGDLSRDLLLSTTTVGEFRPFGGGVDGNGGPPSRNRFLPYLLGGMLAVAAAPVLYNEFLGPKKRKARPGAYDVGVGMENASNRATAMITALAPVVAFPATYIAIDELENRRIISGPLGDSVQALMTTMAGGQLISGLMSLVSKAV